MNLWALNEEMGFDLKFKEKLPVEGKRLVKSNLLIRNFSKYFQIWTDM
jgi:hypothetical protein